MRLIDADELKEAVFEEDSWWENADVWVVDDLIQKAPTVDPVKRGSWKDMGNKDFQCSECGLVLGGAYCYVYCPHCGAKML